ncbi:MAG: NAD(P)/FAD-dependent oxidoreductase [Hahellaceae bacterium]|nr:NAD(P)/FAD-dependent oxidoreductase [Hahellaceae bacterium]
MTQIQTCDTVCAQALPSYSPPAVDGSEAPLIIIGAGPVAIRFLEALQQRKLSRSIYLFGDEPREPYQRIKLSSLLAGEIRFEQIHLPWRHLLNADIRAFLGTRIVAIDKDVQTVTDDRGQLYPYHTLVLATGSRPFVPQISGTDLSGVFTLRTLGDTESLMARTVRSRNLVVAGGGLLGLEAAHALLRANCQVTVVQQSPRLLSQQLDDTASERLRQILQRKGLTLVTGCGLARILGEESVTGVKLRDGTLLGCDTVLLATGIQTNMELARDSGLQVSRGIRVDDTLQTSDPHIFAIGECVEHAGKTYGLVGPGYEQASVLADRLTGGRATYSGTVSASRLKVVQEPVFATGLTCDLPKSSLIREIIWSAPNDQHYRKLVTERGRLVGALAIGDWTETARVQEAVRMKRRLPFWQRWRFRLTGSPWALEPTENPAEWPASTVVCQCMQVSKDSLTGALGAGCNSVEQLSRQTGAGTVCGGCRPLLDELVSTVSGTPTPTAAAPGAGSLAVTAVLALIVLGIWLSPLQFPISDSVIQSAPLEFIWNDPFNKQVSGYTLLTLTLLGLALSLRKRTRWLSTLSFPGLRVFHVWIGCSVLALTLLHTGLQSGTGLNFGLLSTFLGLGTAGAFASALNAQQHKIRPALHRRWQRRLNLAHILLAWPLPVLLALHILTVYFY